MHVFIVTDALIKGIVQAALTEVLVLCGMCFALGLRNAEDKASIVLAVSMTLTLALLLWRPLMLRTLWKHRFPFMLADEVNASILGRVVGAFLGLLMGICTVGVQ